MIHTINYHSINKIIERLIATAVTKVEVTELGDPNYLILKIDDRYFRITGSAVDADVSMVEAPELTATEHKLTSELQSIEPVLIAELGQFIDEKTRGYVQATPHNICGRAIEEMVELGLKFGLTAGEIHAHVTDSLANQATKQTHANKRTVFPSELHDTDLLAAPNELADVYLLMLLLLYRLKFNDADFVATVRAVFEDFKQRDLHINKKGLLYGAKPHIQR